MNFARRPVALLGSLTLLIGAAACHGSFDPKVYAANPASLFAASLKEFNGRHYEDAAKGFEQLTHDLPARDALLPLSYYYLGESQDKTGDHLLAAQSFTRISDAFPDDSLAPGALLAGGRSYAKMWSRPELDDTYGKSAMNTFQSLVSLYPDSKLVPQADTALARLDNMFATKDLTVGEHYLRRKAYDSAIIYLKDVIKLHPNAPATRLAYLKLLTAYRAIKYTADATDLCTAALKVYTNDREVRQQCESASSAAASTPHT
ncbi:MAG: outer membrane protein assembly factor BamD [Gemmatimonadota bacterium]|nr:outer membrane protein assembly factor BamD [Gemmatimonadota bacterium]